MVGVPRLVVWMVVGKTKLGDESMVADCGEDWSAIVALRMETGSDDE